MILIWYWSNCNKFHENPCRIWIARDYKVLSSNGFGQLGIDSYYLSFASSMVIITTWINFNDISRFLMGASTLHHVTLSNTLFEVNQHDVRSMSHTKLFSMIRLMMNCSSTDQNCTFASPNPFGDCQFLHLVFSLFSCFRLL